MSGTGYSGGPATRASPDKVVGPNAIGHRAMFVATRGLAPSAATNGRRRISATTIRKCAPIVAFSAQERCRQLRQAGCGQRSTSTLPTSTSIVNHTRCSLLLGAAQTGLRRGSCGGHREALVLILVSTTVQDGQPVPHSSRCAACPQSSAVCTLVQVRLYKRLETSCTPSIINIATVNHACS